MGLNPQRELSIATLGAVLVLGSSPALADSGWSVMSSPNAPGSNYLSGASCVSPSFCFAVGYSQAKGEPPRGLVERWNGHSWSTVASLNGGKSGNDLTDVACTSSALCGRFDISAAIPAFGDVRRYGF